MSRAFVTSCEDNSSRDYVAVELNYDIQQYNDRHYNHLGIALVDTIVNAAPKRKASFLSGRLAARMCIEKYLARSKKQPPPFFLDQYFKLDTGDGREPQWPQGLVGSITHTHSRASSILASEETYEAVGIDIEDWLSEKSCNEIRSLVASESELTLLRDLLSEHREMNERKLLTVIFSAKESLFKALYPRVRKYFDFKDVEVHSINMKNCQLHIRLRQELGYQPWLKKHSEHLAYFYLRDHSVKTLVLVNRWATGNSNS